MKCGPDGCPILAWADLPEEEQRAHRRTKAHQLYREGFTEQAIANLFKVSQPTIHRDLEGFIHVNKPKRPKGGRPRANQKRVDDKMPTEDEAEEEYQKTIYDQACSMVADMADPTRRKFFAHLRRKYDGEICK
jgi:predicted transcriptional regulator